VIATLPDCSGWRRSRNPPDCSSPRDSRVWSAASVRCARVTRPGWLSSKASSPATNLILLDVSSDVIEHATNLRARYGFRSPDAIHLATAILIGADVFLSGDAGLARCTEMNVVTLTADPGQ
jgi:predicted nucleic acid-binding protein